MTGPSLQPLPPVADRVDEQLSRLAHTFDWLHYLSPVDNVAMWREFRADGYRKAPALRYRSVDFDAAAQRRALFDLPLEGIEDSVLEALLTEKQRELDRQLELIHLRETDGFVSASIDLFGRPDAALLDLAEEVMQRTCAHTNDEPRVGIEVVLNYAQSAIQRYQRHAPGFSPRVIVEADLNSLLMVSNGNLHIAQGIRICENEVEALLAHEIGTHCITFYNGSQQPLRQLASGLAHYDALQEGLGVLGEYLVAGLHPARLRTLAARVIASKRVLEGHGIPQIFAALHEHYRLTPHSAFDVAVRALRGGGLTKDIVYLRGIRDLLAHLRRGGDLQRLFAGKLGLDHLVSLDHLQAHGWLKNPEILPHYMDRPEFTRRLDRLQTLSISDLCS